MLRAAATAMGAAASMVAFKRRRVTQCANQRRVLVTGFNDWHDTKDNVLRCRDNPSCRLLLGDACVKPPVARDGELPRFLRCEAPDIQWHFMALPVMWGAAWVCDWSAYDAVFHIGLGVYDCHDQIVLEDGAVNCRCPLGDVLGMVADSCIDKDAGPVLHNSMQSAALAAMDNAQVGAGVFTVKVIGARTSNSYVCNETHFGALQAVELCGKEGGRLKQAYFIHIPQPATKDNFQDLGRGVGETILGLLRLVP